MTQVGYPPLTTNGEGITKGEKARRKQTNAEREMDIGRIIFPAQQRDTSNSM